MAVAVEFRHFEPANTREDLICRLREAPEEHAEAILAAYNLLQQLNDKNVFSLLNGLLGASDAVINHVCTIISSKEWTNLLRVGLNMYNTLRVIDPDKLHAALDQAGKEDVSLLSIMKQASSKDARRAMATTVAMLNIFGEALAAKKPHEL